MILGTSLLVGFALLLSGGASAQTSTDTQASRTTDFRQTVDIPEENVFAALVLDDNVDIDEIANIQRTLERSQDVSRDVDLDRDDTLLLLALDNRGFGGGFGSRSIFGGGLGGFDDDFLFGSDFDSSRSLRQSVDQRVSIDEEDLLLGLALDRNVDFEDLADFSIRQDIAREARQNSDIDRDDALLLLALDNRGGFGGGFGSFGRLGGFGSSGLRDIRDFDDLDRIDRFDRIGGFGLSGFSTFGGGFDDFDTFGGLGDIDSSSGASRTVRQSVDLDEDDVFAALVLNGGGFGRTDIFDVADIDRSSTSSIFRDRSFDLDRDDVLLSLALD